MVIALTIVHVLMCFAIIAIVLLQAGKGADIVEVARGGTDVRWRIPRRPVAAVALLALAVAGCSGEADSSTDGATAPLSATAAYGDTFIDSLLGNISSLIPTITSDSASHE